MAAPIQNFPSGLQSALDIKGGDLPKELAGFIQGTVDLTQYYLVNKRTSSVFAAVAAAVGSNAFTDSVVPVGELWYVWQFSLLCTCGAGANATIRPLVLFGANGYAVGPQSVIIATQADRVPADTPFICQPGDSFGFVCTAQTLAPNVTGIVSVSKLRV